LSHPSLILLGRPYDRAAALLDGRILVGKNKLRCELAADTLGSFRRLQNDDAVLAGEMSLGFQVASVSSEERSRFLAIPVYLSRSFRHGNVFVRKDSALTDFSQLQGKRVGLEEYAMTMGIWCRGLFADAGVDCESVHWFTAREPVVVPEVEEKLKRRMRIERAAAPIFTLLEEGKIDAAIGRPPDGVSPDEGAFRRLLNDHWGHQRRYYARTGIFPTMHVLVVRRQAYEEDPQIALDLYDAFQESKRILIAEMRSHLNSLITTLPMLEAHVRDTIELFGEDWWPYGIAKNRATLDTFISYCHTQGVVGRPVKLEEIFCPNTLGL
jgi:4,5-dihydroxyphthalate decarboxylase